jgi:hypothetical protein
MDVREHEMTQVLDSEAPLGEGRLQIRQTGARAAVNEGRLLAEQQVGRDDPRAPEVKEVKEPEVLS